MWCEVWETAPLTHFWKQLESYDISVETKQENWDKKLPKESSKVVNHFGGDSEVDFIKNVFFFSSFSIPDTLIFLG